TQESDAMSRLQPDTNERKRRLARSGSLDRIRQFPAYLCSSKILPDILTTAMQSGIEQTLKLVRGSSLVIAVYITVVVLLVQLAALCCALLAAPMPPGLLFLLASLFFMCFMASKTITHHC
ncbi:hypothetical protein L9F63_015869, partial [Diploptera punctata]